MIGIFSMFAGGQALMYGISSQTDYFIVIGAIILCLGTWLCSAHFMHICSFPCLRASRIGRCIADFLCCRSDSYFLECFEYNKCGLSMKQVLYFTLLIMYIRECRIKGSDNQRIFGCIVNSLFIGFTFNVMCKSRDIRRRYVPSFTHSRDVHPYVPLVSIQVNPMPAPNDWIYALNCEFADEDEHEECGKCLCSVCLQSMNEKNVISIAPCLHTFHAECWKQWSLNKDICPYCRTKVINYS